MTAREVVEAGDSVNWGIISINRWTVVAVDLAGRAWITRWVESRQEQQDRIELVSSLTELEKP